MIFSFVIALNTVGYVRRCGVVYSPRCYGIPAAVPTHTMVYGGKGKAGGRRRSYPDGWLVFPDCPGDRSGDLTQYGFDGFGQLSGAIGLLNEGIHPPIEKPLGIALQ